MQPIRDARDATKKARPTFCKSGLLAFAEDGGGGSSSSNNARDAGRKSDQQRSYKACVAGTHFKFDRIADAISVPRIPELGGRIVRSEIVPTRDEAISPVAADNVFAVNARGVPLDNDTGDNGVNGVSSFSLKDFCAVASCGLLDNRLGSTVKPRHDAIKLHRMNHDLVLGMS